MGRWRPRKGDIVRIVGPGQFVSPSGWHGNTGKVARRWPRFVDVTRSEFGSTYTFIYPLSSVALVEQEPVSVPDAPPVPAASKDASAPDVVTTPAYGWRSWTLAADGPRPALISHYTSEPWTPGVAEASCGSAYRNRYADVDRKDHGPPPSTSCGCGLYARTRLNDLLDTSYWTQGVALGLVEAWGTVIHGETGMRAQYARPVLLVNTWAANRDLLRACARRYETELVDADPDRASILRALQGRPGVETEEPSWTSETPSRWSSTSQPTWLPNSLTALSETLYLPTLLRNSSWAEPDGSRWIGS